MAQSGRGDRLAAARPPRGTGSCLRPSTRRRGADAESRRDAELLRVSRLPRGHDPPHKRRHDPRVRVRSLVRCRQGWARQPHGTRRARHGRHRGDARREEKVPQRGTLRGRLGRRQRVHHPRARRGCPRSSRRRRRFIAIAIAIGGGEPTGRRAHPAAQTHRREQTPVPRRTPRALALAPAPAHRRLWLRRGMVALARRGCGGGGDCRDQARRDGRVPCRRTPRRAPPPRRIRGCRRRRAERRAALRGRLGGCRVERVCAEEPEGDAAGARGGRRYRGGGIARGRSPTGAEGTQGCRGCAGRRGG